jgi:hypothetical protein
MKLLRELLEDFNSDLRPGYKYGKDATHEQHVVVGDYKINFRIVQSTIDQEPRYSREHEPESDSWMSDVKAIVIDSIDYLPSRGKLKGTEIDLTLDPEDTKGLAKEISQGIINHSDWQFDGDEKSAFDKYVAFPIHNDPKLAQAIADAITKEINAVYKGIV